MPCYSVGNAIVCTREKPKRCACGRPGKLLCDWKLKADGTPFERGTCSAPICKRCATSPAPGKDLCAHHAQAWRAWNEARATP